MHLSDLHTIVDRFTIAFVNGGIVFELTALIFKREGMRIFGWNCLRLGLGFALLSLATGFLSESIVPIGAAALPWENYHKLLGVLVTGLLLIAVALRSLFRDRFQSIERGAGLRGAYFTLITLTFFLSGMTGVLGTRLVYAFGVNVRPYEQIIALMPPPVHPTVPSQNPISPTQTAPPSPDTSVAPDTLPR